MARFGYLWPPAAVLVAGIAITLGLAWQLRVASDARDRERFEVATSAVQELIDQQVSTAEALLRGGAGMFAIAGADERTELKTFIDRLQLGSAWLDVQTITFAPDILPAGEPMRRAAMERARDTGQPAAAGPVVLEQGPEGSPQTGFVMYVPVYGGSAPPTTIEERRRELRGFVYSPFLSREFFASILPGNLSSRVGIELFDGTGSAATPVFHSPSEDTGRFSITSPLGVAGRQWISRAYSTPALEASSNAGYIPLVIWLGATVTLLLTGLVFLQSAARFRAAQSELAAADATQRFETLANVLPQLAWMAKADGWIYWYNARWYEYTGATPQDMEGWGWQSVHDPAMLPSVMERWGHSIASGEAFEMEFPLRGADGTFRLFLTRVTPLRDREGLVTHWFGTNTDVQYRRDAEQSLQEQARTLATLNATGIRLARELDLDPLLQAVTDAGTMLTRASMGAFFYNTINERAETFTLLTLSGIDRAAFRDFAMPRNTAVFGPTFHGEAPVRSDDITRDPRYGLNAPHHGMPAGHPPVRSYLAVPVKSRSGDVLGGLFFAHPAPGVFTEQAEQLASGIAAQAAVAIDNAQLYRQVQQLLESERSAREEAERVNRLKDEFLATLSHELRTPLNAVLGWARMLESGAVTPEKQRTALEMILRNARAQATLIEDLLDMSRIISGQVRMTMECVDAGEIATAAVNSVRPAAAGKQIALLMRTDGAEHQINADPTRLQQVFWNLLTNAVKFTPPGGRIEVYVRADGDSVDVSCEDTGMGIDAGFLPHVFERFRQADGSVTRGQGGLGLGLSIVKNLVEMHGGTVAAHSEGAGAGARFVVRLPVAKAGDASEEPAATGTA